MRFMGSSFANQLHLKFFVAARAAGIMGQEMRRDMAVCGGIWRRVLRGLDTKGVVFRQSVKMDVFLNVFLYAHLQRLGPRDGPI